MKLCRAVLLLVVWPALLAADNLSLDFTQDDLVQFDLDALLAGWVTRDSPHRSKLMAGAVANRVSGRLDSALLHIDCLRQPVPALRVSSHTWLAGCQGQGDRYALKLFSYIPPRTCMRGASE